MAGFFQISSADCEITTVTSQGWDPAKQPRDQDSVSSTSTSADPVGKQRAFIKSWLAQFLWLKYYQTTSLMYRTKYKDAKFSNYFTQGSGNFRKSALTEHAETRDHRTAFQVPKLQKEREMVQARQLARQEKGAAVAVEVVHWMVTESVPVSRFPSLMRTLHDLEVPNANQVIISESTHYDTWRSTHEFIEVMSNVIQEEVKNELDIAAVVTVLVDELMDRHRANKCPPPPPRKKEKKGCLCKDC